MLNDIYVQEQLARVAKPARHGDHHLALAELRRANSIGRRLSRELARPLGRGLLLVAERLLAYAYDRPRLRLTSPVPPVVELRPGPGSFSQN